MLTNMDWSGSRILVTGASGVIGTALVRLLVEAGAEVITADLKPFSYASAQHEPPMEHSSYPTGQVRHYSLDLSREDLSQLLGTEPNVIFHLAATFNRTVEEPGFWQESFTHNVLLSHRLLKAVDEAGSVKAFVFASSYLIYNPSLHLNTSAEHRLKEGDPINPRNIVGVAKYMTERELDFIAATKENFQAISARIYRVYGRGSRDVISRWVRSALIDEPLLVYGEAGRFDYIFADDVAEGLMRLAANPDAHGVVNLGCGQTRSVAEVVAILKDIFPILVVKAAAHSGPREWSCADMEHFRSLTHWEPPHTLEQGIREIVAYEREHQAGNSPVES
jgi:nucleoside-diphosphate-sugar epimerase